MYDTQKKAHRVKILLFFLHQGTFFAKPRKHRKKQRDQKENRGKEKREEEKMEEWTGSIIGCLPKRGCIMAYYITCSSRPWLYK